jgi:hypothetical protein
MASKIKVDNIENQCGGAVVTKCGATTTISGSVVKADDIQAADGGNIINQCGTTITLGASGDTISLASGASQTGFGRTGTVDWDTTAKTASFTAVSGNGYFVDTTSGVITVTLPAGSAGDIVGISDYASTFQTNALTITPNGTDKINGQNENAILSTQGIAVSLVFVDSTRGWKSVTGSDSNTTGSPPFISATGGTITTCGDCKIHTFTGPGTFTVNNLACSPANNALAYMVVAGGGGGGAAFGGGGGAGGFREGRNNPITPYTASPLAAACSAITASVTAYPITVGAGATGLGPSFGPKGANGSNSIFSSITSTGGGGGSGNEPATPTNGGQPGGSGGGAGYHAPGCAVTVVGSGNTPPTSPSQGNNGGTSSPPPTVYAAGGGGGATAVAGNGGPGGGGPGGAGATTSISGSPTAYAGGGGGGSYFGAGPIQGPGGTGGTGGGGTGGGGSPAAGEDGTANTGGGGGGHGGGGGSGIVIIRYKFQ